MPRPRVWTEETIVEAFRAWAREHDGPPGVNEWKRLHCEPSYQTVFRVFGTWNNALVASGFPARLNGDHNLKEEEMRAALVRVEAGETLASVGRDLGVTGQALGRRIMRLRRAFDVLSHTGS